MLSKGFWQDVAERAVKTFAQTLLAVLAVGVPIWEMEWVSALGIAAGATVLSVLTSVASAGAGNHESASLVGTPGKHRAGAESTAWAALDEARDRAEEAAKYAEEALRKAREE